MQYLLNLSTPFFRGVNTKGRVRINYRVIAHQFEAVSDKAALQKTRKTVEESRVSYKDKHYDAHVQGLYRRVL